jgi:hypothetical protein
MERTVLANTTAFSLMNCAHRANGHFRLTLTEETNLFCDALHITDGLFG